MQRIPLERASEEMKLAKPVVNDSGVTLVREGTVLTQSLIQRLSNLGIRQIIVHGHPLKREGGEDKPLATLERELEERFRPTQSNPLMRQIKEIFLRDLRFWAEGEDE
ncbi:MAG: hypothetical protein JRH07_01305 [Deltaproteobacteria bacterium]|nr:hypothetical protein [Deltaproteobacteria bacterium]MBW2120468.1 hypothetical protein [Deltaproteobacteria bacterium]